MVLVILANINVCKGPEDDLYILFDSSIYNSEYIRYVKTLLSSSWNTVGTRRLSFSCIPLVQNFSNLSYLCYHLSYKKECLISVLSSFACIPFKKSLPNVSAKCLVAEKIQEIESIVAELSDKNLSELEDAILDVIEMDKNSMKSKEQVLRLYVLIR